MIFFDYYYYRMAKAFMKHDGYTAHRAVTSLGFLQGMVVLAIGMLCSKPFFPREVTAPYSKIFGYAGALIIAAFVVYNVLRYGLEGVKYEELAARWQDETPRQCRWRGLAIFTSVPLVMVFNILLMTIS